MKLIRYYIRRISMRWLDHCPACFCQVNWTRTGTAICPRCNKRSNP